VDGFFEWKREGKTKQPFLIQRPDKKPFALAGIWDSSVSSVGEVIESCAVITRDAEGPVAELHDRMPVILPPSSYASPRMLLSSWLLKGLSWSCTPSARSSTTPPMMRLGALSPEATACSWGKIEHCSEAPPYGSGQLRSAHRRPTEPFS
jgi:hypothetical protein